MAGGGVAKMLPPQTQGSRGVGVGVGVRPTQTSGSTTENGHDVSLSYEGKEETGNSRENSIGRTRSVLRGKGR